MAEERKQYEIGFLAVSGDGAEQVSGILVENGAEIVSRAPISRIAFSYPIRKQESAHFGSIIFSSEGNMILGAEKALSMNKDILRHMIIVRAPVRESKMSSRQMRQSGEITREKERALKRGEPAKAWTEPGSESSQRGGRAGLLKTKEAKKKIVETRELTNEALEKKLEEILQ